MGVRVQSYLTMLRFLGPARSSVSAPRLLLPTCIPLPAGASVHLFFGTILLTCMYIPTPHPTPPTNHPPGQREGLDIYTEDLATSLRFLSLKRYWSRSPVMDLDYLLDEVMQQVRGGVRGVCVEDPGCWKV